MTTAPGRRDHPADPRPPIDDDERFGPTEADPRSVPGRDVPHRSPPAFVLSPHTDLSTCTVSEVLNRWLTVIDTAQPSTVTIDLTEVDVVDGSGPPMLRFMGTALQQRGIAWRMRGVPRPTEELPENPARG